MKKCNIRPATRADVKQFYDIPIGSFRAWAGEVDGRLAGVGGLMFFQGRWYAFLDIADEMRPHKVTLVRHIKQAMRTAEEMELPYVRALWDVREDKGEKLMFSLGFRKINNYYEWRPEWPESH